MSETCESLFESRGYGPLRGFFEADGGEGAAAFSSYGAAAAQQLTGHLTGPLMTEAMEAAAGGTDEEKAVLAVFGHAVFLNAIAYVVAHQVSNAAPADLDLILDMDLGETEGLLVNLQTGKCDHLRAAARESS